MIDEDTDVLLNMAVTQGLVDLLNELSSKTGFNPGKNIRNALVLLDLAVDTVLAGGTVTLNLQTGQERIRGIIKTEETTND